MPVAPELKLSARPIISQKALASTKPSDYNAPVNSGCCFQGSPLVYSGVSAALIQRPKIPKFCPPSAELLVFWIVKTKAPDQTVKRIIRKSFLSQIEAVEAKAECWFLKKSGENFSGIPIMNPLEDFTIEPCLG